MLRARTEINTLPSRVDATPSPRSFHVAKLIPSLDPGAPRGSKVLLELPHPGAYDFGLDFLLVLDFSL